MNIIFLAFSKAFDSVNHAMLIHELKSIAFNLTDYLKHKSSPLG